MPSASSRRRPSLTKYFASISVLAMAALGFALVWVTSSVMQQQALRDGTASARSVTAYAVDTLPADVFTAGILTAPQRAAVTSSTAGFGGIVELRLWAADGSLLYSSAGDRVAFPDTERFNQVQLTGDPDARVTVNVAYPQGRSAKDGGDALQVLDVYVPVRASDTRGAGDSAIVGAAEVLLDHTDAADALDRAERTVALVVVLGLVLLWLLLFRTVFTTSRRLQASALENARLALLDSLTGLPNRRLLADRMRRTVADAQDTGGRLGLVLLDIDRFKDINDSLGHDRGDELLEQVAARLRDALRDDDVVARLGGDEFAILLPDVRSVENAERLAHRVRQLFVPPFQLGEMSLHVETSIGVACLPDHAHDASSLMRTADVAMYTAKHHRTGVAVYDADEDHSSPARLMLLGDLHRALDPTRGDDQLAMHYQPKIALSTGETVGYEALMRWEHPTRGTLMPSTFIPLAEQSGLIHDLTKFALSEAVQQLARWRDEGRAVPVAVNLSAHDVTTPAVLDIVSELLAHHGVPGGLLEVEITETALVADPSRIVPVLQSLDGLGVRVAIDDFGIGNTSISQLRDLPVDELKIDRLFVADLGDGGRAGSEVVVQAMVDLAHSFGLRVVAEGVEDARTASVLESLGVDLAQGFHYAPALPADEAVARSAARVARDEAPKAERRGRGRRTPARTGPSSDG